MMEDLTNPVDLERAMERFRVRFAELKARVAEAIVGQDRLVEECLLSLFSQGHVLLEGVPGLGKTYLVTTISEVLGLSSGRVQCTPDLMPSDILGTHIVAHDGGGHRTFRFEKGPVFRHLLLVDEINRATPKTQSALLEVMQERAVTAGGERHVLPSPFFVIATQNPLEMEGTYPLPEAQLDRFLFKLRVPFPDAREMVEIVNRTTGFERRPVAKLLDGEEFEAHQRLLTLVPVAETVLHHAAGIVLASHPDRPEAPRSVKRFVAYGSSPRGLQALVRGARARCLLDGRTAVSADDVRSVAHAALRHRIILNFEGEAESADADRIVDDILESRPEPGEKGAA